MAEGLEQRCIISGIGQSELGRRLTRGVPALTLDAIGEAGPTPADIDGVVSWPAPGPAGSLAPPVPTRGGGRPPGAGRQGGRGIGRGGTARLVPAAQNIERVNPSSHSEREEDMNLATLVDQKAAQFGDRVLAIFDDDTVTYAQVAERAGHVAAGLRDLGVTRGRSRRDHDGEPVRVPVRVVRDPEARGDRGADPRRRPRTGHLPHPQHDRGRAW